MCLDKSFLITHLLYTVELQWFEQLRNNKHMFEIGKFELYRSDSNKYTQYTIFNNKKENHPKLSVICRYEIFRDSRTSSRQPW